jgi:hypothetical protein
MPAFTDAAKASAASIAALAGADAPLEDPVLLARAALAAGDLATAQAIRGKLTGDTVPGATTPTWPCWTPPGRRRRQGTPRC